MTDNDTVQKDGQEVPTPRTGLRASNTLETLRPREVNIPAYSIPQPLQGRGLPPLEFFEGSDSVRITDLGPVSLPLQGRGLPPIGLDEQVCVVNKDGDYPFLETQDDFEKAVRKADWGVAFAKPTADGGLELQYTNKPEAHNVLPVDWPTASETMGFQEVERAYGVLQLPLTERVLRLEEQVDAIKDRIAAYNVKSGHKI